MTFESLPLTPFYLFRESQGKKMDIDMLLPCFLCKFGWNKVKYAKITITHVCFIALTFAGFLGRCLNTRSIALVFKQLLGTRQTLMHEKTCVILKIPPAKLTTFLLLLTFANVGETVRMCRMGLGLCSSTMY